MREKSVPISVKIAEPPKHLGTSGAATTATSLYLGEIDGVQGLAGNRNWRTVLTTAMDNAEACSLRIEAHCRSYRRGSRGWGHGRRNPSVIKPLEATHVDNQGWSRRHAASILRSSTDSASSNVPIAKSISSFIIVNGGPCRLAQERRARTLRPAGFAAQVIEIRSRTDPRPGRRAESSPTTVRRREGSSQPSEWRQLAGVRPAQALPEGSPWEKR